MTDDVVAHLSPESLDEYFSAGIATHHLLLRSPRCELRIDPGDHTFELFTPAAGAEPDVAAYQRVTFETVSMEDGPWFCLQIDARDLRHEAYGLVVAVVEAMRGGAGFAAATTAALTNMRAILASRRRLNGDQQVGLLGELLVVRTLLLAHGEEDVIPWWLGPLSEQHDLALADIDVEVKTTTSERRVHVIHGTGQLEPNPGRELWIVSIQITRAGGAVGLSLAGLVGDVTSRLQSSRVRFAEYLHNLGWRDADADLYRDAYLLRSAPAAYLVDEDFPALTTARLASSVPHSDLVSVLSYRVDVTNRVSGSPAGPIAQFLTTTEFIDV